MLHTISLDFAGNVGEASEAAYTAALQCQPISYEIVPNGPGGGCPMIVAKATKAYQLVKFGSLIYCEPESDMAMYIS